MADVTPQQVAKSRKERDVQELIRAVLRSPLKDGECYEVDGETPIKDIIKHNTDIRTRMFLQIANQAMSGDIKSASFLMKYGGYEPADNKTITIDLPRFVDDVSGVEEDDPSFPDRPKQTFISASSVGNEEIIDVEVTVVEDERWRVSSMCPYPRS